MVSEDMGREPIREEMHRDSGFGGWTPRDIENRLHRDGGIISQDRAVRTAALIVYNHMEGRPSVSLFAGPTGSGKTAIWRALQRLYGGEIIAIHDASTLSAEGWKGDNKISTIFRAVDPRKRGKVILVLDEFDKVLAPMYGAGGTNYSDLMQNQLLRLCDHDILFFGVEGEQGFQVDCSGVSVVLLGTFSRLLENKARSNVSIGFRQQENRGCDDAASLTVDDLVRYGMREELAGRIDRVIPMHALNGKELARIGQSEILRLEKVMQREITFDPETVIRLADRAAKMRYGARWLKSRLNAMLDELVYQDPDAPRYCLEDGMADLL